MVYMVYQLESPDITTIIDYCEDLLKDEKIEKMSWMSILKCWKPELI